MLLRRAYVRAVLLARPALVTAAVLTVSLACVVACETEPVGVDSCRRIEGARCENAKSCGINLTSPVHRRDGETPAEQDRQDVGACKRFYEDACLHGLVTTVDPGAIRTQACVDAINNSPGCDVVKNPETHPDCAFLYPPAAPAPDPDAGAADAATTDAATD